MFALAFLAGGCLRTTIVPSGETSSVRAIRYEIRVYDGFQDANRRGGRWISELFFPEADVCCNLEYDFVTGEDGKLASRPVRLNAWKAEMRRGLTTETEESIRDLPGLVRLMEMDKIEGRSRPVSEIDVPIDLATEIFALADLVERRKEASAKLGAEPRVAGILPRAK